jgi:glycosyltransferase involved in cell wall biosynthesis
MRHVVRRWLAARADRVIVNGASGERYLLGLGCPPEKIDRLPQPALPEFASVGEIPRSSTRVHQLIFVGQLTELKGLVPFIHELDGWARTHPGRRLELTIVGSGTLRDEIENIPHVADLEIKLTGELDPLALAAHFACADALVFPTLADEWGLVVNEALAAGVPVLGSIHSQAVVELCEEGSNGWVFDPEDEVSTRSALDRMFATGETDLAAMRVQARERVREMTPEWAADLLVASIESTLARTTATG